MGNKALTSFIAVFIAACFIAPFGSQVKDAVVCTASVIGGSGGTCPPIGTPPCEQEDSPGPCTWDAQEQGNGKGISFWTDAQQRTHVWGR